MRNAELRAELAARGVVAPLNVASYHQLEVGVRTAASQLEAYDAILDVAAMEHALGKGWTLRLSPLAIRGATFWTQQQPQLVFGMRVGLLAWPAATPPLPSTPSLLAPSAPSAVTVSPVVASY